MADNAKKHVALEHLWIIKDYIDSKASGDGSGTVVGYKGMHDIRVYDGKLQYKENNTWNDITSTSDGLGGSGTDGAITSDDLDDSAFASDSEISNLFKV